MNLALDIGNTRTKLGLFEQHRLIEQAFWVDWNLVELVNWATQRQVERVIVSTVAEQDPARLLAIKEVWPKIIELTHQTPLPFLNAYRTPHTLGKDRLANVAGAWAVLPGRNCLVIDCGTCIKYDVLDASGTYLGGNIAPGLMMRTKAMHHFTARLPEVAVAIPAAVIGNDTTTALQNGAFRGALIEIVGFIQAFAQELGALPVVILTGGDAAWVQSSLEAAPHSTVLSTFSIRHIPELTLLGLNEILLTQV